MSERERELERKRKREMERKRKREREHHCSFLTPGSVWSFKPSFERYL